MKLETGMYRASATIGDIQINIDRRDESVALAELIRRLIVHQAQKEKEKTGFVRRQDQGMESLLKVHSAEVRR